MLIVSSVTVDAAPTLGVKSGLRLWLSADAINATDPTQVQIRNGNTYVTKWLDQSTNNFHAVQATADKQPVYYSVNGLTILRFDGVNDFFTTTLPQIVGDKSIFVVQKRIGTTWRTEIGSSLGNSGAFLGNNLGLETVGRVNIAHDLSLPGLNNAYVLKGFVRSGGNETLYLDDASVTAAVPDGAAGTYTISSPTSAPFFGAIAEVLIYDRAITDAERQLVENYLSEKYSLWTYSLSVRNGVRLWLSGDGVNTGGDTGQVRTDANGTFVQFWTDRSTAGPASQTGPSQQPKFIANAINSRPALRFDGFDDYVGTPLAQIVGDKSIFIVNKRNNANFAMEIAPSVKPGMLLGNLGTAEGKARWGIAWDLTIPSTLGQFNVKSWMRNGGIETLRLNDTAVSTTVPDLAAGKYRISDPQGSFPGDIAEVIIYDRAVGDTERLAIENYLFEKYSHTPDNIFAIPAELTVPAMTVGSPAPGVRVKQTAPEYAGTNAYHALYLPTNWVPGNKYPVLVEYAGNGDFVDFYGERHSGAIEDTQLGYGISAGRDFIWISMPTIGGSPLTNQVQWWGDLAATKDYCLRTVRRVCEEYGGDPSAVILTGFSRGSIACNYVGLADDTIADAWLAFIPHSHYDGTEFWGYPLEDVPSALSRLQRLKGRLQHISNETAWTSPEAYLRANIADMTPFSFRTLPFGNHTDSWPLRPIQLRRDLRAWVQQVLANRPGTHAISGLVTNALGAPVAGARVESGFTHFTTTDANGQYTLAGLIDSARTVTVTAAPLSFTPAAVTVAGSNLPNVNFVALP